MKKLTCKTTTRGPNYIKRRLKGKNRKKQREKKKGKKALK